MRIRVSAAVAAGLAVLIFDSTAMAQTGLFHESRRRAASVATTMTSITGSANQDDRWIVGPVVIDDFSDARGQAPSTVGRNGRLILMVGCSDGQLSGIAIGGLGGVRVGRLLNRTTPDVIFRDGSVDFRWGDEGIISQTWTDFDQVLVLTGPEAARFLDPAVSEDRLRIRATSIRGVLQDEFDLRHMQVTGDTVRIRDTGQTPPDEMICRR